MTSRLWGASSRAPAQDLVKSAGSRNAPAVAAPSGNVKTVPRRGRDRVTPKGDTVVLVLTDRFVNMLDKISLHYRANVGKKFEDSPLQKAGVNNRSASTHIAVADWLNALNADPQEPSSAAALEDEFQEYYVAVGEKKEGSKLYLSHKDIERYNNLIAALQRDPDSFIHKHNARTLVLLIAIARYARIHCGVHIGLCDEPDLG